MEIVEHIQYDSDGCGDRCCQTDHDQAGIGLNTHDISKRQSNQECLDQSLCHDPYRLIISVEIAVTMVSAPNPRRYSKALWMTGASVVKNPATRTRSPTILMMHATSTNNRGDLLSPSPLNMADNTWLEHLRC